ncbi:MAG TPA: glycosyltransferase family 4 protein [Candidatus Eisenbacteria bacterium]|nr:glycosyltransferase family 4 protein [Candidatus Eisenbacteria bacterium]
MASAYSSLKSNTRNPGLDTCMTDRPLRFCMITTFYPPYNFGGDGIFVQRLANELGRRGHTVDVIHCIDAYRLSGRSPAGVYDDHPNVTVHGLKSPFGMVSPLATHQTGLPLFKSSKILKILNKGFDVINYYNISLVGGPRVLQYGHAIKLYTILEYWLVCPTNVLFKYNREPCTKPSCFTCSLAYKRPPQLWRYSGLMQSAVKHVDAFIAPSRFGKEVHRIMGLNVPTVEIPYFVPFESPAPVEDAGYGSKPPYFLFVGRLEKLKGLQTLMPVFRQRPNIRLLVAGTGLYEPKLRQLAQGVNVEFLGRKTAPELSGLYRHATAVIVPSICYDNSPLVTYEAFREKTPVIARDLGGMGEPVRESGGGFVYKTDAELLAAMDRLLADQDLRRNLGEKAHATFLQKWTPDAHLKSYFGLIEEIAAERAQRSAASTTATCPEKNN